MTELGAARFVAPTGRASDGFAKLNAGFAVGPTLATGFKFFAFAQALITITSTGGIGFDASQSGWALNDTGYFGFKFSNASGTHYGWGQVNIDGSSAGSGYTILNAYYNDTPDAPITVAPIPEPSHVAILALGAAGVAAWRRRRRR
ncbi:MAG: PEP-CTERM sorting domain-containing protein [Verrucomicrobiae bacterium]|nr:PEP-CTERM sorting domain-containing protein [Verrucomicrobiae bacterium]